MGPRKSKRRRANSPEKDSPVSLHALISALQSPQGVSQFVLKRCYLLLNQLSSIPQCSVMCGAKLNNWAEEISVDLFELEDIVTVSDLLFKELAELFEDCFSSLSREDDSSVSFRWDSFAIVNLLLRCCLLLLTLPQINQEYIFQKGQVVLGILRQLRSAKLKVKKAKGITFERSISSASGIVDDEYAASSTDDFVASLHFLEPSSSCLHFVSGMLEVILDELLIHGQIRSFLKLVDSFIPTGDHLCLSLSGHGDSGVVLEVICAHFCLAFSDEQSIEELLTRLFCVEKKNIRYSPRAFEVGSTAATLLLLNPIILSAPKFIQAHVVAFVSEAISSCLDYENLKPDRRLMNCLLTLLEKSVALYTKHIHNLQLDKGSTDFIKSDNCKDFQPPFESFLLSDTGKRISRLITKLDNNSESYFSNTAKKTKTNVVSSAIGYVKDCQDVFDKPFQDSIFSILSRVIIEAYNGVKHGASNATKIGCPQDLCILATVLKLMSTSLLRAVSYMRYSGDLEHPKCLSDINLCKEYDTLSSAIGCFANCSLHLPFQHLIYNMMKASPRKNQNTRMMFLHFSGLLSLSFSMGLDFLIKGSLSTLMALLNLIAFEEGNLDILRKLCDSSSEPFSSGLSSVSIHETHTDQKFSRVIASKFVRTRTFLSRSSRNCLAKSQDEHSPNVEANLPSDTIGVAVDVEEQTEETSNGEVFLNCVLTKNEPDFDELADFVECKQGKDYSCWVRNRRKYRMWKEQKMAILRWKRKKQTWRIARGKKSLTS